MPAGIVKTVVIVTACCLLQGPCLAHADFYTYKDGSGTVHMTNSLDAVPKKYRSNMKVVTDESLAKRDPGARKAAAQPSGGQSPVAAQEQASEAVPAPPQPQGAHGQFSRFPWLKPLIVVAGLFAAFLVVVKIAAHVSSPHLTRLIYLSFFLGVFVYGYKCYADHVVGSYFSVKQKVLSMFMKANEREAPSDRNATGGEKP